MALSHQQKRRWSLVILLIGLPLYIGLVVWGMQALAGGAPVWAQVAIYVVLGVVWVLPFKQVFLGVGQADPNAPPRD